MYLFDEYYIYNVCFDFFVCEEFEKLRNWYDDDIIIDSVLEIRKCLKIYSYVIIINVIFILKVVEV